MLLNGQLCSPARSSQLPSSSPALSLLTVAKLTLQSPCARCRVAAKIFVFVFSRNYQFRVLRNFPLVSRNTKLKFVRNFREIQRKFRETRNRKVLLLAF